MNKEDILRHIRNVGLVPVLRAPSEEIALAVSAAIEAGGVPLLEVTMTVPGAIDAIKKLINGSNGKVVIGAGTVLDPETARACILAGAQFIVSPSLNLKTIEICHRYSVPVIPGALTPTEIVTAWEAGADVVKVFPCSSVGGAKYIAALHGPLPQINLIPTGGVTLATAADFLGAGSFALGIGSDLADPKEIVKGTPETITANARKYVEIVEKFRKGQSQHSADR